MSDKELASGADSDLGAHFKILLMGPLTPKGDISPINVLLDYYYPTIKNEMYRAYKDVEWVAHWHLCEKYITKIVQNQSVWAPWAAGVHLIWNLWNIAKSTYC